MHASGLFFLSSRPTQALAQSPTDGQVLLWTFPMVERLQQRGVQKVMGYWRGNDADVFVSVHGDRLKPGLALRLELDRLRTAHGELEGRIVACELAPDRWPKTEVDPTAEPSASPSSPNTQRDAV